MELRHLRYFMAVAEELHFGRAAQRLHIAQPPLSRQIQDLEAELGITLFDRSPRGVELTHAGTVFLGHVRRVFGALDLAVHDARRASAGETGRVVVGYLSSLTYTGIVDLVRAYRDRFPTVDIALREMSPQEQIDALKEGRIDVGFVRAPLDEAAITHACMRSEELVVALPIDHPLAAWKRIPVAMLSREPFVTFPRHRGPGFFDQIIALCHAAGFSPRIVQEAPQIDIPSLVAAGFGISILPESIREMGRRGIVLRPLVGGPRTSLLMVWRSNDVAPAVTGFVDFARRTGLPRYGVKPAEDGAKASGDGVKPKGDGVKPKGGGVKPKGNGVTSKGGEKSKGDGVKANGDSMRPKGDSVRRKGDGLKPRGDGVKPKASAADPGEDASNPAADEGTLKVDRARSSPG
ncbi:LysR substrate-binding domain-containing protein [Chondromyces apiculatus]|uniref:Putative LysR-family transcriptional regulator n=1 Tax=Chondromyces apiculatus DSM 436 TaxID=1192034 RepID=A0A017T8N7_9BACT|nr:LysR substrate-binding domain-containing protein [Chondromyces apiculatus]EYF05175.1 putative LysR-family transcriptional regulator [Chondromyces apiculatus DSM 436]